VRAGCEIRVAGGIGTFDGRQAETGVK
jgi:hypothetical protein